MYKKDLSVSVNIRISEKDSNFLKKLSEERKLSVSDLIRSIISDYRRSLEFLDKFSEMLETEGEYNAFIETDCDDLV